MRSWKLNDIITYILKSAAIVLVYFISAKIGFSFAFINEQVSPVWPPAGVALSILLIFGHRYWPAIFAGAFIANFYLNDTIVTDLLIAVGNTLEALVGFYLLKYIFKFTGSFSRAQDFVDFMSACAISTLISAAIGATALTFLDIQPDNFLVLLGIWWLGDFMGQLVIVPFAVMLSIKSLRNMIFSRKEEFALLIFVSLIVNLFVFLDIINISRIPHSMTYIVFPLTMWAAFRFSQLGAAAVIFITSFLVTWGTTHELGPFSSSFYIHEKLITSQLFVFFIAVTSSILAIKVSTKVVKPLASLQ